MRPIDPTTWSKEELLAYVLKHLKQQRKAGRANMARHRARCKKLGVSSKKVTPLDAKALMDARVREGRRI